MIVVAILVCFIILGTWVTLGIATMHHDPLVWNNPQVSYVFMCSITFVHMTSMRSFETHEKLKNRE